VSNVVTLAEAKMHLKVTQNLEDSLLQDIYIPAAEFHIRNILDGDIPGLTDSPPAVPAPLKAAALLIIGDLYENREQTIVGTIISVNQTAINLVHFYRDNMGI